MLRKNFMQLKKKYWGVVENGILVAIEGI